MVHGIKERVCVTCRKYTWFPENNWAVLSKPVLMKIACIPTHIMDKIHVFDGGFHVPKPLLESALGNISNNTPIQCSYIPKAGEIVPKTFKDALKVMGEHLKNHAAIVAVNLDFVQKSGKRSPGDQMELRFYMAHRINGRIFISENPHLMSNFSVILKEMILA